MTPFPTLNPRIVALFTCEKPRHNEKEWFSSYHVRREIMRAMETDE
jgi:hypothetical protein